MRLSELGEFGLLAELERLGLVAPIPHDAAQIGPFVVTQDTLVEKVHFRLDWLAWRDLGRRAAAVNVSDLSASGARPRALLVSIAAPPSTSVESILELYRGLRDLGVEIIGGDTTSADDLVITVTAIGESERVPGRDGARPGDLLVVTGPLGAAGAAFRHQRYVAVPVRTAEGVELARHAHALMDISDGIARDAGHIAARSGVRCTIDLERVPLAPGATLADLGFGEDFELLAAVEEPGSFTVVGRCGEGEGVELLLHGEPHPLGGWEHFR